MSWLTSFIKPKIQSNNAQKDIPDNLWVKCSACQQVIFHREFANNLNVCHLCGNHALITPLKRFEYLYDAGEYELIETAIPKDDPLKFVDTKKYTDRLAEARKKNTSKESAVVALGKINDILTTSACHDYSFMAGTMGVGLGNALVKACEIALDKKTPLICFSASGGARMQEGIFSLMQMPRILTYLNRIKQEGLPYLVVLTDPTLGGVTASYAMLGDIHIAEPNALIGFAGPRVIEQIIRQKLPEGAQKAEYFQEKGMVDMILPRQEQAKVIGQILTYMTYYKS